MEKNVIRWASASACVAIVALAAIVGFATGGIQIHLGTSVPEEAPEAATRSIKPPAEFGTRDYLATVDRVVDGTSGTFGVRLELPNPDYAVPSGLRCQVRFLQVD